MTRDNINKSIPPALNLLPYQRRWVEDDAPFKIVAKARQVGYSFAATLRAVLRCLERKTTWIFLSKGERQSRLLMEKVQEHIRSCGVAARSSVSSFFEGTMLKQLEIRFPNGSVIYGLPANPDTARGYTGHVTLDEFAFHQDAAKVYAALYPTITRGFSIEVISTPNGCQGKFYELAQTAGLIGQVSGFGCQVLEKDLALAVSSPTPGTCRWSGHRTSISDAVAQGLEIDLAALRAGCDDEETWLQEYCCEFLSDAQNYIPLELILQCVSEGATAKWLPSAVTPHPALTGHPHPRGEGQGVRGDLFLGVDIGRKRDLTVAWLFEKLGDVMWSRELVTLRNATFETQERAICDLIEGSDKCQVTSDKRDGSVGSPLITRHSSLAAIRRCSVDQSGLGMMLAERLEKKYGAIVEPVQFTAQVKERLAPMVKQAFEDRTVRIPDDREVRADINAVKRFVTPAGNLRFDAEHTDRGHADRFWALALALSAAAEPVVHLSSAGAIVGRPVSAGLRARVL